MFNKYSNKIIGAAIFEGRKKKGIQQNDLAACLGFSAQFLGRIEKGFVRLPEKNLPFCVKKLGLNRESLSRAVAKSAKRYFLEVTK